MMFPNGDGTFSGGPLDVMIILHNVEAGTFHAAIFEHAPFPGTGGSFDVDVVRLKSKGHHTVGATSFEGSLVHLDELLQKIKLPPENVWREREKLFPWDGEIGIVLLVPNWTVTPSPSSLSI